MRPGTILVTLLLLLLAAPDAVRADRIVLKNGNSLTGRIVRESETEVLFELGAGMRLTIRRDRIRTLIRSDPPPEPPADGPAPRRSEEPEPSDSPEPPAVLPAPKEPPFATGTPASEWAGLVARHPVLHVAKLTRFRAYELLARDHLALAADSPLPAAHGHGGAVARWRFRYRGNRDLLYGDEVKFVAEITSPGAAGPPLIELVEGPYPAVDRMVAFLVRRGEEVERWFTPTAFPPPVFRQTDLRPLPAARVPVRTYDGSWNLLAERWLAPKELEVLDELGSPLANSLRVRLERLRFRHEWYGRPPAERPELDVELVARHVPRPLLGRGGSRAEEAYVRMVWGPPEEVERQLAELAAEVAARLEALGVRPEGAVHVQVDRIGLFGERGVTIDTRRHSFPESFLEVLRGD